LSNNAGFDENACGPTCPLVFTPPLPGYFYGTMFLNRRTRTKDGKTHVYFSVCESLRVSRDRVVQRQILHLGELNTAPLDSWQHSIDVLHEDCLPLYLNV
jgi:hypothetical protein